MDSFPDERVVRFNAEGTGGLIDRKAPGKAPRLNAEQRAALARAVGAGPKPHLDGVVRWRLIDLVQRLWEAFGERDDRQSRIAGHGVPEAFRAAAAPCPGPSGHRAFQRSFPDLVAEIREKQAGGKRMELRFQE